jgi:ABC-type transport system involved in cytochrome c biogenesis permease subunit
MKRFLPLIVLAIGLLYLGSALRPAKNKTDFNLTGFGSLPVLVNGRIKPLDTVARTSLLVIQSRQRVSTPEIPEPFVATPNEWLADVLFNPAKADTYPTLRISASDSPELVALMNLTEADTKINYDSAMKRTLAIIDYLPGTRIRFSYEKLRPKLEELDRQARLAYGVEDQLRSRFQRQILNFRNHVMLYLQLKTAAQVPDSPDFAQELVRFEQALPIGIRAILAKKNNQPHDEAAVKAMKEMADRFTYMEQLGQLRLVPPDTGDTNPEHWRSAGTALMESFATLKVNATVMNYARLGQAWRAGNATEFNRVVAEMHDQLAARFPSEVKKSDIELQFNHAEPFYRSMTLYVWAFLIAIFSWLIWPQALGRIAFWILLLAFVATTVGIITRMWIESRPPVTNLYSSALFVGWGAVGLCLILEKTFRNGVGSAAAGLIGFVALLIAHHLSLTGDTMEMMRAVLDTNLWLATHVVVVTLGYSATFLAGFLAIIYIFRGLLTKSLDKLTADTLGRMVYGIVCFATLFSLVGTVLGGIWADQSWGRFWGWDPKENGALLIVIWNATILHARAGGMIKQRGLMVMAVFGNIVTSWSWFGTNMLGVGLHSYGFMDAAFNWLITFVAGNLLIMALGALPLVKWKSFKSA